MFEKKTCAHSAHSCGRIYVHLVMCVIDLIE